MRKRWEPRGGYAPSKFLTPRDARRVYYVMRTRRVRWPGANSIIVGVRKYEQKRCYARIGPARTRRAVHWLVENGFVRVEPRKPFTRDYRKTYVVVDPAALLPDSVPAHEPRKRRKYGTK